MKWGAACVVLSLCILAVAGVVSWRTMARTQPSDPSASGAVALPVVSAVDPFSPFQPLPLAVHVDERKSKLGGRLFQERRLSADGTISCSTCHDLIRGGADGRAHSVGIGGAEGTMNAPTVLNCGFNFRQFWDGRAETLEEQVDGPLLHANEMAANWADVIAMLQRDTGYVQEFGASYADGITADNVRNAIATFERSLVTPGSRFDHFLEGKTGELDAQELAGYRLFNELGCGSCHQGVNMGGNMFQVFGRVGNYFADRGSVRPSDLGRFNVTGDERDRFKFKVPSLRNVALTAPYFHDGSAPTLEQAVRIMARYQIGQALHDEEVAKICAFLSTLTGELRR